MVTVTHSSLLYLLGINPHYNKFCPNLQLQRLDLPGFRLHKKMEFLKNKLFCVFFLLLEIVFMILIHDDMKR